MFRYPVFQYPMIRYAKYYGLYSTTIACPTDNNLGRSTDIGLPQYMNRHDSLMYIPTGPNRDVCVWLTVRASLLPLQKRCHRRHNGPPRDIQIKIRHNLARNRATPDACLVPRRISNGHFEARAATIGTLFPPER